VERRRSIGLSLGSALPPGRGTVTGTFGLTSASD